MTQLRIALFSSLSIGLFVHTLLGDRVAPALALLVGAAIASSVIAIARSRMPGFLPATLLAGAIAAVALARGELDTSTGLVLAGAAFAAMGAVASMWSVARVVGYALASVLCAEAAATVARMIVTRVVTMPSIMMLFSLAAFAGSVYAAWRAYQAHEVRS